MSADNWEPAPMPNENNAHEKRNAAIAAAKAEVRRERHTREPWRVHDDDVVSQAEGGLAVCVSAGLLENRAADARRIVACVNACVGIPTATLTSVPPGTLAEWWTRMLRNALSEASGIVTREGGDAERGSGERSELEPARTPLPSSSSSSSHNETTNDR